MNELMNRLVALRSAGSNAGAAVGGAVAGLPLKAARAGKLALEGMRRRDQQMLDAERERNQAMIIQNFGSLENYQRLQNESPLPEPTIGPALVRGAKKIGRGAKKAVGGLDDLFSRLLSVRSR